MTMRLKAVIAAIVVAMLNACAAPGASQQVNETPVAMEIVRTPITGPFDENGPIGVAWPTSSRIVVSRGGSPASSRQVLSSIDSSSYQVSPLAIPVPDGCVTVDARLPRLLPTGLVVDLRCYEASGAGRHELMRVGAGDAVDTIARLEWFPDSVAQLADTAWVAGLDSGTCAFIELVAGTPPVGTKWPFEVTDDGDPFAVNAGRNASDCDGLPKAFGLAQAADGRIAFLASGAVRGTTGFARTSVPVQLYLRAVDGSISRVAAGFVEARSLQWARDGQHLLVVAQVNQRSGIWRVDLNGDVQLLYQGDFQDFAEAPDGTQLAVIVRDGPKFTDTSTLVIATFK